MCSLHFADGKPTEENPLPKFLLTAGEEEKALFAGKDKKEEAAVKKEGAKKVKFVRLSLRQRRKKQKRLRKRKTKALKSPMSNKPKSLGKKIVMSFLELFMRKSIFSLLQA